jgi:hypothetical protein
MYDMYPWDSASQGEYPPQPLRSVRNPARRAPRPRDGSAPSGSARNGSARNGSATSGSAGNGTAPSGKALNGHARDITPAQAVQAALDRRDNGGEARPASQAARPASQAATLPAASQGRQ